MKFRVLLWWGGDLGCLPAGARQYTLCLAWSCSMYGNIVDMHVWASTGHSNARPVNACMYGVLFTIKCLPFPVTAMLHQTDICIAWRRLGHTLDLLLLLSDNPSHHDVGCGQRHHVDFCWLLYIVAFCCVVNCCYCLFRVSCQT